MSYLIIDGNSIGFASHNAKKLTVDDMEVQAIFGVLRSMRGLVLKYNSYRPLVLWDGRSWRKDVFVEYKSNRDSTEKLVAMRDGFKKQRPYIARALSALGVPQVMAINLEADDLAGMYVAKMSARGETVVLISGDRDWLQLVSPSTMWVDPIRNLTVTYRTFESFTGYATPAAFVEGKCLQGDNSDKVPGVGGIGKDGAKKLLAEYGSVEGFLKAFNSGGIKKPGKRLTDFATNAKGGLDRFKENRRLMCLTDPSIFPKAEKLTVTRGEFNPDAFRTLCEDLAFHSILRDFDRWVKPFAGEELQEAA